MNGKQLYREIGLVDEDLIQEAWTRKKNFRRSLWLRGLAAAACGVVGIIGLAWQQGLLSGPEQKEIVYEKKPGTESGISMEGGESLNTESAGDAYALVLNPANGQSALSLSIPGHFWEQLTDEETDAVCPAAKDFEGCGKIPLTAHYNGDGGLVFVEGTAATDSGGELYIQAAPGAVVLDCIFQTESQEASEIDGVSVVAGYFDDTNDGMTIYFANFTLEDVGYYVELKGGNAEMAMLPAVIDAIICGGKADFTVLHTQIPEWREDSLTLEEAYGDEEFGDYLPKEIPEGFAFEEATRIFYEGTEEREETNYLSCWWQNGYDEINWHVSYLTEEDKKRITAVSDTVNYDLSLYPIPWAKSVPEDLMEIVDNPIFEIEELTEDAVRARAYRVRETEDTDGYRMGFSVLYDGNVLVDVRIKGVNPETVYQMLTQSLSYLYQ